MKSKKKTDTFKATNVEVSVDLDEGVSADLTDTEVTLDDVEQAAYEQNGHTTSDVAYIPNEDTVVETESKVDISDETPVTETDENPEEEVSPEPADNEPEEYQFGYTYIDSNNYVNFIEQLCCVDFVNQNVDTSKIPLSEELRKQLEEQGCVNKDALKYSFIVTDNGYNDEADDFYVVLHVPNETKDFIAIEGVVEDDVLVSLKAFVAE